MVIRHYLFEICAKLLCGTSRPSSRRGQKSRTSEKQRPKYMWSRKSPKETHASWYQSHSYAELQDEDRQARIGQSIQPTARQWGQATVKRLERHTRPKLEPSTSEMGPGTVCEVINIIGTLFDHVPYAVSGVAAMVYYGNDYHRPTHVSVLVPDASREIVRCWAVAQGMNSLPGKPDSFAVTTKDGVLRTVRIKTVKDASFENIETVRAVKSQARLITLPGLANQLAGAYISELKSQSTERRQQSYARDMRWVLNCIADVRLAEHWLLPGRAKDILKADFWLPFTSSFPDTILMFAHAGLDVGDDGTLHNDGTYEGRQSPQRGGNLIGGLFAF
ncbi:hypothetical protein CC79DRAFT_1317743 [Sarocladium strictum]